MLTYTPKYRILDYSDANHSQLLVGHFLEHKCYVNSPAAWSTVDIEASGIWFIYKLTNSDSACLHWMDNYGNFWSLEYPSNNPHYIQTNQLRKSGVFEKPMPDLCIENIVSGKWIIETGKSSHPHRVQAILTTYLSMFFEMESLKATVDKLEDSRYLEMSEAYDEIWAKENALETANQELALLKAAMPEVNLIDFQ